MKLLTAVIISLFCLSAWSQDSRWIDLEWEAVPLAREYQIELFQEADGKFVPRGKYKTDSAAWSHAVPPGKYSLRLRSVDSRGVPGEWSQRIPLKVRMQNPLLLRPVPGDKVSDPLVVFEWGAVAGAAKYQLVVKMNNKIIHNAVTPELKSTVYVEDLGDVQWTALALENDEESKTPDEITETAFQTFNRVGGELDAPKVSLKLNKKVIFSWDRVKAAQLYEVDYFPPPESGAKNRRFKLKLSPLAFSVNRLKEGVTTLTIKSMAPGYQDSKKSIVKISRSGDKIELEDLIQGKENVDIKTVPTRTFFKNELYAGVALAKFTYESENIENDTRLNQESLTGLGVNLEWNRRPTLNSLNRKFEISILHLSSGIDSGLSNRLAYTYHKERKWGESTFSYGAGLSYLSLPAFMGNRFEDEVKVETSSSIGPDFQIGLVNPLNSVWELQSQLILAYHPYFISSYASGEKAFPWMKALFRLQRYYTDKQAFYAQIDYQTWTQEWAQDSSTLSGLSLNFGLKTGF